MVACSVIFECRHLMEVVDCKTCNQCFPDRLDQTHFPKHMFVQAQKFALHHFCSVAVWRAQIGSNYGAHNSAAKGCAVLTTADKAFKADFRSSVFLHAGQLCKQLSIIQSIAVGKDRPQKGEAFLIKLLEAVRIAVLLRKAS